MRKLVILTFVFYCLFVSYLYISSEKNRNVIKPNQAGIFDDKNSNSKKETKDTNNTVTIFFGGDVMLGRNVMIQSIKNNNYSYPFIKIADITKKSDIFFVNLENPITKDCPSSDSGFKFCALPVMLEGLKNAGVNVVGLANNHILNYGFEGLLETEDYLQTSDISPVGVNKLVRREINDIRFGFISFDFTVHTPIETDYQLVKDSDSLVDYLIIGVHWGEEYKDKANSYQRRWARELVINGADIIVGHHAHWVSDFECLSYPDGILRCADLGLEKKCICDGILEKPIYYSLGNLVFDQMWSEETKKGMLIKLDVNKNGIVSEQRLKTYIKNSGQPEFVEKSD